MFIFAQKNMNLRSLISFLILVLVSFSCSNDNQDINPQADTTLGDFEKQETPCLAELLGLYIGDFGGSSLRIEITYLNQHKVLGYNLLKGLQRNLSGDVFYSDSLFTLTLNEPGDHEHDGKFILYIDKSNCSVSGEWHSNSGKISARKFNLEKIELNSDYDAPISLGNLADRFDFLRNELGHDIQFFQNGKVKYTYYVNIEESENSEAKSEIFNGNWFISDDEIVVEFEKNIIFKEKKVYFKMIHEDDYPSELLYDTLRYFPAYM